VSNNREIGRRGEEQVADYLRGRGYIILARNFYYRHREIDIVALKDRTVAFVEVKSRSTDRFGTGLESVTPGKIRHIVSAARYFLYRRGYRYHSVRFDVASLEGNRLRYVKDAFHP
jgi:putative endonuclease